MATEAPSNLAPEINAVAGWRHILLKALAIQIAFLALHYVYEFFPSTITSIFGGINESVFQHLKTGFFAYALISILEYFIRRKNLIRTQDFLFTRLFSTTLYPWIVLILFLVPPAFVGQYQSIVLEIVSANIVLFTASIFTIIIEGQIDGMFLSKQFKIIVLILFVVAAALFVIFTYQLPWFDVFVQPPGWER